MVVQGCLTCIVDAIGQFGCGRYDAEGDEADYQGVFSYALAFFAFQELKEEEVYKLLH